MSKMYFNKKENFNFNNKLNAIRARFTYSYLRSVPKSLNQCLFKLNLMLIDGYKLEG